MDVAFLYRTLKGMHVLKPLVFRRTPICYCIAWKTKTQRTYQTFCDALIYRKHGPYSEVLKLERIPIPQIDRDDIHVRMLAAPINPADINMIQGTWRTEAVCKANEVIPVANDISVISAATLSVNPCTAYRMLKDFVTLRPGDTVIQNGANSGVGQAVIQICASFGVNTINIIRDRSNLNEMVKKLQSLGANYVITEDMLQKEEMANLFKVVERPKLALNCVGGSSAGNLFYHLKDGSTMVTYGGMSRKPTPLPAKALIFKNIKICGFWMTQWKRNHLHDLTKLTMMVSDLTEMIRRGQLSEPSCTKVPFYDFSKALQATMESYSNKHVLIMN
ncbi:enoyl-[acyl-carrier-protein] reductase, mitochondrial-like isoform X2 [Pyxicephalus adspersus]|uniref:enoyl-[acyl-carrier-protein] reductase, mitochondrial-like isoform X2 n=1 Tax=Pyxicephalus adspersus TaxID=30357 RepID=UPI003B58FB90